MGHHSHRFHTARITLLTLSILLIACTPKPSWAIPAGARLVWTTPGDNGGKARVLAYDLRISTNVIQGTDTLSWWKAATKIDMTAKIPRMPAMPDSIVLGGLNGGVWYYAILRSVDAAQNWSDFSNVATFVPGMVTGVGDDNAPEVVVGSPRPSPTSGRTEVSLSLPAPMAVLAVVYDAQGRLARRLESGMLSAGQHLLRWDGTLEGGGQAASGVYYIRVVAGTLDKRVKLVVVR